MGPSHSRNFVRHRSIALIAAGDDEVRHRFTAHLGNDPTTCNNHTSWTRCTILVSRRPQTMGHLRRLPHPARLIPGISSKPARYQSRLGLRAGRNPAAIRARGSSLEVAQENCVRCHAETVSNIPDGQADAGRYASTPRDTARPTRHRFCHTKTRRINETPSS